METADRPGEVYDVSVGHYCQRPAICVDSRGWVWVAVVGNFAQRRPDGQPVRHFNGLWVKCRGRHRPDPERLSDPGVVVWQPRLAPVGADVWAVWMQWAEGRWRIVGRRWQDGQWGEEIVVADGPGDQLHPDVAADADGMWVAWQQMAAGRQRIFLRRVGGDGALGEAVCLSEGLADSHRPAIAVASDGTLWAAWDVYLGGHDYRVVAGPVRDGRAELSALSGPATFNGHCAMAAGADGTVWLAWYRRDTTSDRDSHRILLRRFRAGRWEKPVGDAMGAGCDGAICSEGHFRPALAALPDGSLAAAWTAHGTWRRADLLLRRVSDERVSPIKYVEPNAQAFARAGAKLWFVQEPDMAVGPGGNLWAAYSKWQATQAPSLARTQCLRLPPLVYGIQWEPADAAPVDPLGETAQADAGRRVASSLLDAPEAARGLRVAFMDLHGHCEYSFDARGTADQWFNFARDVAGLDGVALTDHDVTPAEHYLIVAHANHYYRPEDFVALAGMEEVYARPAGGEKQILWFSRQPEPVGSLFHVGEEFLDRELARELVAAQEGLVITHDGSFLPGCVDTDGQDERTERLAQITSTHTGRLWEDFEHYVAGSRRPPQWPRVSDALRAGLRYGFVGGSDSHGSRPEGRTAIWVRELTRDAVREALWARRCYATTGPRLVLWTELGGRPMGSEVAFSGGQPRLKVWVVAEEDVGAVAAVTAAGEQRAELGGARQWAGTFDVRGIEPASGRNWVYVRVEFVSGARAWSSPHWLVAAT